MKDYSLLDHVLMRLKDVVLIGGAAYAIFVWVFAFASIPKRVEATETELSVFKEYRNDTNLKIQQMQSDITYIAETVKDIRDTQKIIVNRNVN